MKNYILPMPSSRSHIVRHFGAISFITLSFVRHFGASGYGSNPERCVTAFAVLAQAVMAQTLSVVFAILAQAVMAQAL